MRIKKYILFLFSILILSFSFSTNINAINFNRQIDRAGTYFIELETEDSNGELNTIKAHITFPKTKLNYDQMVGLDAQDIIVAKNSFDVDNVDEIIRLAKAHAWSMNTGVAIEDIKVDVSKAPFGSGSTYEILFSVNNSTSVSVNVFELDEIISLDTVYMKQDPVIRGSIRNLSLVIILLSLIPIFIYLLLFTVLKKQETDILSLLTEETETP